MNTAVRIFVDENEFDFANPATTPGEEFSLKAETSVSKQKAHYFETLGGLGEIVRFKRDEAKPGSSIASSLNEADSLVASFHEPPPELPCRLLQHTKGGLMLPGGFLGPWTVRKSTMNFVETERQKTQIKRSGGSWKLPLEIYAQRLACDVFHPPSEASRGNKFSRNKISLIYAGRFIPNKGLSQLIRGLTLWPIGRCSLSLMGEWEPHFLISQSGSQCVNYKNWFSREVLSRNKNVFVSVSRAVRPDELVGLYRKSDAFVYPSFHEDEASGNAPHEAILSGIPAIVTDWCGLGQLGRNTRGGAVATYPTLGGIRFSLKSFRDQVRNRCNAERSISTNEVIRDAEWVRSTFDPIKMKRSLASGIEYLLDQTPDPPLAGGWRSVDRLKMLIEHGPKGFSRALRIDPGVVNEGLYSDGSGYESKHYSEPHFLTAIQALYTTWPTAPVLKPGVRLHGFWRVAPWEQERALVEFGFPGPRVLRFSESEWRTLAAAAIPLGAGDFAFEIRDAIAATVFQRAVEFGYLVPDDPMQCDLPEALDPLPQREPLPTGSR